VKVPLTFSAPTRRTIADSSNEKPDAIIREPTAVDAGTYIERNVRLAVTCDQNNFQKFLTNEAIMTTETTRIQDVSTCCNGRIETTNERVF